MRPRVILVVPLQGGLLADAGGAVAQPPRPDPRPAIERLNEAGPEARALAARAARIRVSWVVEQRWEVDAELA